jgi:pimeloyl-ACP methyl ester carboxylesterase
MAFALPSGSDLDLFGMMSQRLEETERRVETRQVKVHEPDGSTVSLAADFAPAAGPAEGRRPVVLLHAIGLSRITWEWVLPRVAEHGPVWAFDLLGFGESDKPAGADYRVSAQADRIVAALDVVGIQEAIWVGNSLGAAISLAAAVHHPERVGALALIGPAAYREHLPLWARMIARVPGTLSVLRYGAMPLTAGALLYAFIDPRRVSPRHLAAYASSLGGPGGAAALRAGARALYSGDLDRLTPHYREVQCPALILQGTRDRIIPATAAQWLLRDLPQARLEWLDGLGHFPQEEDPDRVAAPLVKFLTEL